MPAIMSSRFWGFNSFIKLRIPALSSWNTPSVLPVPSDSNTRLSSKLIRSMSIFTEWFFSTRSAVFFNTVNVLRPKKSIFKSPNSSIVVMVNCVVIMPSMPLASGTYSSIGFWEITTPAAWVEECLGSPSNRFDISIN